MYTHVLELNGIRHPVTGYEKLKKAREYIRTKLEEYQLTTEVDEFIVEGFSGKFANIHGLTTSESAKPEFLVTAHHDSVYNSPGATDNAAVVAIILETARILNQNTSLLKFPIRFISFDLEEGNPTIFREFITLGQKYGIYQERTYIYKSVKLRNLIQKLVPKFQIGKITNEQNQQIKERIKEAEDELSENDFNYLNEWADLRFSYQGESNHDFIGKRALIGSDMVARRFKSESKVIAGMINYDPIGFTSTLPNSQRMVEGVDPDQFPSNNLDPTIGNFVTIISLPSSQKMGQQFYLSTQNNSIDLPSLYLRLPFEFEVISANLPDLLRSDHAGFWREGYPAIFISDTANFRNPFYHTPNDSIEIVDFEFVKKVCQATILTILKLSEIPDQE